MLCGWWECEKNKINEINCRLNWIEDKEDYGQVYIIIYVSVIVWWVLKLLETNFFFFFVPKNFPNKI